MLLYFMGSLCIDTQRKLEARCSWQYVDPLCILFIGGTASISRGI